MYRTPGYPFRSCPSLCACESKVRCNTTSKGTQAVTLQNLRLWKAYRRRTTEDRIPAQSPQHDRHHQQAPINLNQRCPISARESMLYSARTGRAPPPRTPYRQRGHDLSALREVVILVGAPPVAPKYSEQLLLQTKGKINIPSWEQVPWKRNGCQPINQHSGDAEMPRCR